MSIDDQNGLDDMKSRHIKQLSQAPPRVAAFLAGHQSGSVTVIRGAGQVRIIDLGVVLNRGETLRRNLTVDTDLTPLELLEMVSPAGYTRKLGDVGVRSAAATYRKEAP